jgi:hypothetical protein
MEENQFKCNECRKYYKSYQSLWNHKKKFHQQISTNDPQFDKNIPTIHPQNIHNIKIKKTDQTNCEYCNKILSCYNSMNRHLKICKTKQDIIKENEELKQKTQQQEQRILNIEQKLENISNKMELTSRGLTTTNNNTNNGTINNNINIYNFGSEKILENLPKVEAVELLRLPGYNPVLRGLMITHFSKENPEGHTIFINNIDDNNATIYDAKKRTIISEPIEVSADTAIQNTIWDLEELKEKHKEDLNKKQINNIDNIVVNDYPPHITDKFKKMAYENKDMVKNTMEQIVVSK